MNQNLSSRILSFQNYANQQNFHNEVKQTVCEIIQLFSKLDNYTNNLQQKIDALLQKQQFQFFKSYRNHILNVQNLIKQMQSKIIAQEQKINEYQAWGNFAQLLKKSNKLEKQILQLYKKVQEKDKTIQNYKIQISILQKQQCRLNEKIKKNYLSKRQNDIQLFTTIPINQTIETKRSNLNKTTIDSTANIINNSQSNIMKDIKYEISQSLTKKRYQNQIVKLQKKNKQLLSSNVKSMSLHSQLQYFFYDCVKKVERDIIIRNKINYCTFQQFKKEDKTKVLTLLLENDQLIKLIYDFIFHSNNIIKHQNLRYNNLEEQNKSYQFKSSILNQNYRNQEFKFPQIKMKSRIHFKNESPRFTINHSTITKARN